MMQIDKIDLENDDNDQSLYTEIFSWGSDKEGQMGLGENKRNSVFYFPRICSFSIVIHQLSCGFDHTAFVAKNGYLYIMGSNALGKLGLGQQNLQNSFQPQLVNALSKYKVMQVSCGHSHTCAIVDSGELFSWGDSSQGQLGLNSHGSFYLPQLVLFNELKDIQNSFVTDISCGYYHSAVVLKNGQVCTFGSGKKGQLGTGNMKNIYNPALIPSLSQIFKVRCGHYHTLFLDEHGRIYSTGLNDQGQLGLGYKDANVAVPKLIIELQHAFVSKIFAGSHSAVITDTHEVYFFGNSNLGEFLYPQLIQIGANNIKDISIGNSFGIALASDGRVFSWGTNDLGQLGQGDNDTRLMPSLVESLLEKKVLQVSCGDNFVVCLGQVCDTQLKFNKSYSQKSFIKMQSPQSNLVKDEPKQFTPSSYTPQKGMIKSQSQLIIAKQASMMKEISKQNENNQNQQNGIYFAQRSNKMRASKSVHSPLQGSGIFGNSNQYSPENNGQIDLDKEQKTFSQIKSQKDAIFDSLCTKSINDKMQNSTTFQTGQKRQNPSDSIGQLSTREGIKQSPNQLDLIQDFTKQIASPNQSQSLQKDIQFYNSKSSDLQASERKAFQDDINNLEKQIAKKNEYILKLQNEMKHMKGIQPNMIQYESKPSQREIQLKKENCDLILENARLQEDNSQLLNVLQQQADQIGELMKDNRELNVKLKHQIQQHEVQNKIVNQKLVSYTQKIQDLEKIYQDYNSVKDELKVKDDRIQILEEKTCFLNHQLEIQTKNTGFTSQYNALNETTSKHINGLENTLVKKKGTNQIKPLSIDIKNYDTVRNQQQSSNQDGISFRGGNTNTNFFSNNEFNENFYPTSNKSQTNNNISNVQPNLNNNNNYNNNNCFMPINYQQPNHSPLNIQKLSYQSSQTNLRTPNNYKQEKDQAYPYQQKSILKNSPIQNKMICDSRIMEEPKHNVSFTDLDQLQAPLSSSRQRELKDSLNCKQVQKAKSYSFYQPNQGERKNIQLQINPEFQNIRQIGIHSNTMQNKQMQPHLKQMQHLQQQQQQPNQYFSKQNSFHSPTTTHSQASRQLDFLSYQKQSQTPNQYDLGFQNSINRTKKQLETRMSELNKKLSSNNMF